MGDGIETQRMNQIKSLYPDPATASPYQGDHASSGITYGSDGCEVPLRSTAHPGALRDAEANYRRICGDNAPRAHIGIVESVGVPYGYTILTAPSGGGRSFLERPRN